MVLKMILQRRSSMLYSLIAECALINFGLTSVQPGQFVILWKQILTFISILYLRKKIDKFDINEDLIFDN